MANSNLEMLSVPRGGADAWDVPQAGVILSKDFFITATVTKVYVGVSGRSTRYLGVRADSALYLGTLSLF